MNTWRELIEGRHALSTGVVVLSIAVPALKAFITSTVLPTAVAEIGGLSIYAWGSTAYAVTSIVGSAGSSVVTRKVGTRAGLLIAAGLSVSASRPVAAFTGAALGSPRLLPGALSALASNAVDPQAGCAR